MVRAVISLLTSVLRSCGALFRTRRDQAIIELALRQQLAVYVYKHPRPRLSPLDRAFWVALSRLWPQWRTALLLVRPETVIRWHRKAFRGYWRWISKPGPGRPPISEEVKALIVRMATENGWRARRIREELAKLGIHLGKSTISRYLPKLEPGKDPQQRWATFLRNHRDVIAGMDFFVVPIVHFRLLYAWFAIDHGRRRILHFNVTAHPTAGWVMQQLREAFPGAPSHRYLIFDNDSIFSPEVARSIKRFGIHPKQTALQSPWQNGTAERFVGSVRRELLDHIVVLNEDDLRRLLRDYVEYYNSDRVHTAIHDAPNGRPVENRPSERAKVFGLPRVGGLLHRYTWAEAA